MEILSYLLLGLGAVACVAGLIFTLIAAFTCHVGWGLAVLFVPLAQLVFTALHWAEARKGFLLSLAGGALLAGGLLTSPVLRQVAGQVAALSGQLPAFASRAPAAAPINFDEQILRQRTRIEELEGKFARDGQLLVQEFNALTQQRNLLKDSDQPAVAAFNNAVAQYQAHNNARKAAKDELAALRLELETLQDQRSRQQAAAAKRVVMYTTESCGACKMAKSYFARKGVKYDERDVNTSPEARAEFQKLGGRGVPLILVGNERMEGFSAQRLDQLL